ncbi:MAG: UvrD-helicase domain-containing protein, partial [Muribaculaceae bacterium]|nr:UvrD-helicase domain-containing protein [Muribaculaceae bacterium]
MEVLNKEYFEGLNEAQRMAVEYDDGPSLVIAGAGSGKTRVLTCRVVHLLENGVEPNRIVALTFTNKAAREMRERIEMMVGAKMASRLWMGTFHSIFLRILRINADKIGFKNNFTIYDAADSKSLIKTIIKDMGLDDKVYKPSTIQNAISTAKNALISPEAYALDKDLMSADKSARRPRTHEIYKAYRTRCVVAGVMDFDDILYYMNTLLRDNPDVLTHWQEYFKYLLVDEYQDTNFAQHLIVSRLTEKSHRFCVVGDDAQSIYSFRGANIRNILNLKKTYPDLKIFKLEQNYRSTQTIVAAANSLIKKNKGQIDKTVFSKNEVGGGIEIIKCKDDGKEATTVVNRIRELRRQTGDSLDEFAILYRTNSQSRAFEDELRNANIEHKVYGSLSFYDRKEIKDAVSYFRLAVNPDDDEALRRVINMPARGIGDTTINKIVHAATENQLSMWGVLNDPLRFGDLFNKGTWRKIDTFVEIVSDLIKAVNEGQDAFMVAKLAIQRSGLITSLLSENTPENVTRRENLEELLNAANRFVTKSIETEDYPDISMSGYLSSVSLATSQDKEDDKDENGNQLPKVTLMTVHAAKGLEFNNVFIVGVEDDLFPSAMSKNNVMEIEEERRLL